MKKIYCKIGFSILVTSIVLSSCRARFYTPNRNPVPLFQKAGDVYIDASSNLNNKYDITAGYAITNGLAGYIGYAGATEKYEQTDSVNNTSQTTTRKYNGNMLNLGIGYFINKEQSENFRFEIFGDIGLGTYNNKVTGTDNQYFNGNYTRVGIMPNFGYTTTNNKFSIAYSIRYSNITFSNASISNTAYWDTDLKRLNSKPSYNVIDHGVTLRGGSEKVKFQMQLGFYQGLDSDEVINAIPKFSSSIMLGLVINTNVFGNNN